MKMKHWSRSKWISWWCLVVWTFLVTLIVGWGTPLFAMPSAGQLALILELTVFGAAAAIGIGAVIEAWKQMLGRHR
jgi:hypothetical protein